MFDAWGRFVHRRRLAVLALSLVVLAISAVFAARGGDLTATSPGTDSLEAFRAQNLAKQATAAQTQATGQQQGATFLLILSSPNLRVTDPAYQSAAEAALKPLKEDPRVTGLDTPYSLPAPLNAAFISRDGREALVQVHLKDQLHAAEHYYPELRSEVHSDTLTIQATGNVPISEAFNKTLETDVQRAERLSLPATLILLLVVFGAVVAALLPLGVGVMGIVGGVGGTFLLSRFTDVSQYAVNIVTLIGLGVAIDYSLFIVNRYREELAVDHDRERALGTTMATAGRAITFSGLTVAIGLSAMLFYQGTFMASMGFAGGLVVAMAVFYALTALPAVLSLLGPRIDAATLPFISTAGHNLWRRLAPAVMARPLLALIPALAFLLLLAVPFTQIRLANGDVDMLPPGIAARVAYDKLLKDFPGQDQNTFQVVVDFKNESPTTPGSQEELAALEGRLESIPGILHVTPAGTSAHVAVLNATGSAPPTSDAARSVLKEIRKVKLPNADLLVGGRTAFDVDTIAYILQTTPLAIGFVIAVTYVVLFLLTGSLVLPLKAVLMNLLSVSASFGALVFVFQQGHLSGLLHFTPQDLDPTIPVLLFSIVFGLSMDYEVLLVSRIHEEYRRSRDNRRAVAEGLEKSGRLITGAAAIMVAVFISFGMADVVLIKAIGIGLAVAVALDATIVRALLVPSVMRILGDWNWWAPRPLARLAERLSLSEPVAESRPAA